MYFVNKRNAVNESTVKETPILVENRLELEETVVTSDLEETAKIRLEVIQSRL